MRTTHKVTLLAAALIAAGSIADPVQVSVTGTAQTTEMGYTAGNSYTFTWTVNENYTGSSSDIFDSSLNYWGAETTSDPLLWSSVSGDGLSGTYIRPSGLATAPQDYLYSHASGLDLTAGNGDPTSSSMGLTVNGTEVRFIHTSFLNIPGLDNSATEFENPASWLSDYAGTHTLSTGFMYVRDESNNQIDFTPTSATIAIPEPSTIAFVGIFGGGLWIIRRYFPAV